MDLFEFEEAVKNGEITDVEPYIPQQECLPYVSQ